MSKKIILITGASSGFGRLTAEALAKAGNTVYASMRDIAGRNAKNAAEMAETSKRDGVDLRAIELDVQSEPSIDVAVKKIMAESGKIVPRRLTGVCAPHQHRLSSAIKQARNIALLPFAGRAS